MPNTFEAVVLMCGVAGIVMVNVRNPALGLFVMGFMFFLLALWMVRPPDVNPIEFRGEISGADADSLTVRIKVDDWPVRVGSDGRIADTVRPNLVEKLSVEILAPGHTPARWRKAIEAAQARKGLIEIRPPAFAQVVPRPAPDPNNIKAIEGVLPANVRGVW